jgi:hypothetical protein
MSEKKKRDNRERAGGKQVRFVFGYHEHEGPSYSGPPRPREDEEREMVREVRQWEWEQEGPADLSRDCDQNIRSLADLMTRAREFIVEEGGYPDELVQIPFDKLAVLMDRGGWSFVGGDFMEFEGNHNDTEITVVLERKVPGS